MKSGGISAALGLCERGFSGLHLKLPKGNLGAAHRKSTPLLTLSTCTSGAKAARFVVRPCFVANKVRAEVHEMSLSVGDAPA